MKLKHLLLVVIVNYWTWLVWRVLGDKLPLSTSSLIKIFLIFALIISFFKYGIKLLVFAYAKLNRNKDNTKALRFTEYIQGKSLEWIIWLETEFLNNYVRNKKSFSIMSQISKKWIDKHHENIKVLYYPVFFIPWISSLSVFFYEFVYSDVFYVTLYFFALNFLIRRVFGLVLFLAKNENEITIDNLLHNYFWELNSNIHVKNFFLAGNIMTFNYFFHYPEIQNKRLLIFLWNILQEVNYLFKVNVLIGQFIKPKWHKLISVSQDINLIIYLTCYCLLVTNNFDKYQNLCVVLLCLLSFFSIFLVFLFSLKDKSESIDKDYSLSTYFSSISDLEEKCKKKFDFIKFQLLEEHDFLTENDLLFFKNDKTVIQMHKEKFYVNFVDFLTKDERNLFSKISLNGYSWFMEEFLKGNICFKTYKLKSF